jgi:hypothetical protein
VRGALHLRIKRLVAPKNNLRFGMVVALDLSRKRQRCWRKETIHEDEDDDTLL